jgi:Domain of unknown function (DUF4169)
MGEIVNLRRGRKQRARVAATKDSAAKRAKSGRVRAEREATRAAEENRFAAHRRMAANDRAE